MKKTICVVTGTRAEYGLLRPLIVRMKNDADIILRIVVTGMHLSKDFGFTYKEIENDGFTIDEKIDILESNDDNEAMSHAIGKGIVCFTDYFAKSKPDMVVILGDRFEIFAVATAAAISHVPIAHLYGGETTEGAVDEFFRHSITKMSYLHFTSTERYRQRVINMGESPDRVFNVGALGVENILHMPLLSKDDLSKDIGFDLSKPYALVTFHPVTLENNTAFEQFSELLDAIYEVSELNYIFTKANADPNGRLINKMIDSYCKNKDNVVSYTSLGVLRYLSAMKYCSMVIGNSSSGIEETPAFHIPTINIGDRQKGRICSESVISCNPNKQEIIKSIRIGLSNKFNQEIKNMINPFGDGNVSIKVFDTIKEFLINDRINIKKSFFDVR